MKVVLILSLALVLLVFGSYAGPSRVKLPPGSIEDIKTKGRELYESFLEWRKGLPEGSDKTLLAYVNWLNTQKQERELESESDGKADASLAEVEERFVGPNPLSSGGVQLYGESSLISKPLPIVSAFGFSKTELEELYQSWLPKVPAGEDSSFQAFLDWMKVQDEPEDDGVIGPENYRRGRIIRWVKRIKKWFGRKKHREYVDNEQNLAETERSVKDEEPQINEQEALTAFGFSKTELEELYQSWLPKVPAGEDSSFQAFLDWMKVQDEPEDNGVLGPQNYGRVRVIRWFEKIKKWFGRKKHREYVDNEQNLAEAQRSVEDEEPQINEQEALTDVLGKRSGFEGEQEEAIVNSQKYFADDEDEEPQLNLASDLEPSNKPGPKTDTYSGEKLFDVYREWLKTVAAEKDKTFKKFLEWFNTRKKPRSLENELIDDQSPLTEMERREGEEQEDLNQFPLEEQKKEAKDTSGAYSCESNSPCTPENIVKERFYFATASLERFIQCSAWGSCKTFTCGDGLIWDDAIKTCSIRT